MRLAAVPSPEAQACKHAISDYALMPFTRRVAARPDVCGCRFNSIPAFTAQVTMDLFQRQTQC